jgi:hypothetical protein
MKKIIRLTESDLVKLVKRIISEQPTPMPYHNNNIGISGLDDGAAIPLKKEWDGMLKKQVSIGGSANYGTGESMFANNPINARRINNEVLQFCRRHDDVLSEYTSKPKQKIQSIVKEISTALETGRYQPWNQLSDFPASITGRGVRNEAVDVFEKKIEELDTINNFCYALKYSEQNKFGGEANLMEMFDEIQDNRVYYNKVLSPMLGMYPEVLRK